MKRFRCLFNLIINKNRKEKKKCVYVEGKKGQTKNDESLMRERINIYNLI